jgi:hypothetical protein
MRRRGAEISKLRVLMGHASTDTTSVYVHHQPTPAAGEPVAPPPPTDPASDTPVP